MWLDPNGALSAEVGSSVLFRVLGFLTPIRKRPVIAPLDARHVHDSGSTRVTVEFASNEGYYLIRTQIADRLFAQTYWHIINDLGSLLPMEDVVWEQ